MASDIGIYDATHTKRDFKKNSWFKVGIFETENDFNLAGEGKKIKPYIFAQFRSKGDAWGYAKGLKSSPEYLGYVIVILG